MTDTTRDHRIDLSNAVRAELRQRLRTAKVDPTTSVALVVPIISLKSLRSMLSDNPTSGELAKVRKYAVTHVCGHLPSSNVSPWYVGAALPSEGILQPYRLSVPEGYNVIHVNYLS